MNALLAHAKLGEKEALDALWYKHSDKLTRFIHNFYMKHKSVFNRMGLQHEDLEQEGYLAFRYAIDNFSGGEMEDFAPYLFLTIKYWFLSLHGGFHGGKRRQVTDDQGRKIKISAEPLDFCTSADAPIHDDHENPQTYYDTFADPMAELAFEAAENRIWAQELHDCIEKAMAELPENEQATLRAIYYSDLTREEAARLLGMDTMALHRQEIVGLYRLRCKNLIRWCWDEYILCQAWHGTGYQAWKSGGSVQERTVEKLEQIENKAKKGR